MRQDTRFLHLLGLLCAAKEKVLLAWIAPDGLVLRIGRS
jgi:hypothetical protein